MTDAPLLAEGWTAVPDLLSAVQASVLAEECERVLASLGADVRTGDKPHSGTRHLVELLDRVPAVGDVIGDRRLLAPVQALLGAQVEPGVVAYRCPTPGHGGQRLHADASPMLSIGPDQVATAIVALTDFTEANGATRVVPGSHRRPDLQRLAGNLEHHPYELLLTGPVGTAFVFSGHLLHSGTPNRSSRARPSLQVTFSRSEASG